MRVAPDGLLRSGVALPPPLPPDRCGGCCGSMRQRRADAAVQTLRPEPAQGAAGSSRRGPTAF